MVFKLPSGGYHYIYTVSDEASCFLYFYLNETALFFSDLYENFNRNMMWTYNRTIADLEKESTNPTDDQKLKDELMWLAYNRTLIENSKTFLNMIALNRTDTQQDLEASIQSIVSFFAEKKLNQTKVYYEFVNHFYSDFEHKTIRASHSQFYKIYRKLRSEYLRFKQR